MSYDVKSIRNDFKKRGIFYTPKPLAKYMQSFLPNDLKEIYDPTCGHGDLLSLFGDDVEKYGQDINNDGVDEASRIPNSHIVCADTLVSPAFMGKKFRGIISNYPYSIKWNPDKLVDDERFTVAPVIPPKSRADYAFILHILHYLADDGVAVVMCFPGIGYRGQREGKIRRWMIEQNYVDTVIHIPGGKFVDTSIPTLILVIRKKRDSTNIRFINKEDDVEYVAPLLEVRENDFSLSVSTYARKEPEKEVVDPAALEKEARNGVLDMIRKEVMFSFTLWKNLGGQPIDEFLDGIEAIVNEYREMIKC